MGHYLASNAIVDRGYAQSIATTYPFIGGHPLSNILTRRLSDTWQGAGGAGRYFAINHGGAPPFRLQLVWLVGCTLAGAYRIRIASGAGTTGVAVYDATYTYSGVGPCVFLLPGHYVANFVSVFGPTVGTLEVQRLVLADALDVSNSFRTDWGQTLVDPNPAQSSAPGGAVVSTSLTPRRQRAFTLAGMSDADVWGADSADGHGASFAEICASCGTTGEVILLPRVTPGVTGSGNEIALRDFAIYGTFDRAPSFKAWAQDKPAEDKGVTPSDADFGALRRLWQSGSLSLSSVAEA